MYNLIHIFDKTEQQRFERLCTAVVPLTRHKSPRKSLQIFRSMVKYVYTR